MAYDSVVSERDRLREKNDQLIEHLTRMDRVEHGTPEVPRAPKSRPEPMPKKLLEYINSFASPSIRAETRNQALKQHRQGKSWADIMQEVMDKDG